VSAATRQCVALLGAEGLKGLEIVNTPTALKYLEEHTNNCQKYAIIFNQFREEAAQARDGAEAAMRGTSEGGRGARNATETIVTKVYTIWHVDETTVFFANTVSEALLYRTQLHSKSEFGAYGGWEGCEDTNRVHHEAACGVLRNRRHKPFESPRGAVERVEGLDGECGLEGARIRHHPED
jgi:hypothetical protein